MGAIASACARRLSSRLSVRPAQGPRNLADAVLQNLRKTFMGSLIAASVLIIDDFGMPQTAYTAAEDLLEIIIAATSATTLLPSNRRLRAEAKSSAMLPPLSPCSTIFSITGTKTVAVASGLRA
jgi:DNA replication protein DnaC